MRLGFFVWGHLGHSPGRPFSGLGGGGQPEEGTQVPLGRCPRDPPDRPGSGERQQAAVAGQALLVAALAIADPVPGEDQQLAQALGGGCFGEVPGATGYGIVLRYYATGEFDAGALASRGRHAAKALDRPDRR